MKSLLIVLGLISLAIATPLQPVLAPAIGKGVAQIQPLIEIETYKSLPGFPYLVPVAPVHPEQLPEQNVYELPQPPVFVERFPDTSFVLPESPVFVETQSEDKSDKSDVKPHMPSFVAPEAPIFIGNQPEEEERFILPEAPVHTEPEQTQEDSIPIGTFPFVIQAEVKPEE